MDKATQSKERLSGALLELLKTVPYEDITVQRISDHAGVSRMAFYRNFDSKDDVIRYYLKKQTDHFLQESHITEDASFGPVYFRKLIDHLSRNRDVGMLLVNTGLFDLLRAEFDRIYTVRAKDHREMLRSTFIAGGICNAYYYWLVNGCREAPSEFADNLEQVMSRI